MKTLLLKLFVILMLSVGSQDLVFTISLIATYIVAEVAIALSIKIIRVKYTQNLIESGYLYKA